MFDPEHSLVSDGEAAAEALLVIGDERNEY